MLIEVIPASAGASAILLQNLLANKWKMAIMWQDAGRNMTAVKPANSLEGWISPTFS